MDKFALLIHDLGGLIGVPLHLDAKRVCKLHINQDLYVQIEEEEVKKRLVVASILGEVPPGAFREKVCKEALKENNLFPKIGTLAFSQPQHALSFFTYIPHYEEIDGDKLADILEAFIERAFLWKKGLQTGLLPQRDKPSSMI